MLKNTDYKPFILIGQLKTFNRKNKHKQHENIVYRVQCSVQRIYNMDYALKLPDVELYNDKGWRK